MHTANAIHHMMDGIRKKVPLARPTVNMTYRGINMPKPPAEKIIF